MEDPGTSVINPRRAHLQGESDDMMEGLYEVEADLSFAKAFLRLSFDLFSRTARVERFLVDASYVLREPKELLDRSVNAVTKALGRVDPRVWEVNTSLVCESNSIAVQLIIKLGISFGLR